LTGWGLCRHAETVRKGTEKTKSAGCSRVGILFHVLVNAGVQGDRWGVFWRVNHGGWRTGNNGDSGLGFKGGWKAQKRGYALAEVATRRLGPDGTEIKNHTRISCRGEGRITKFLGRAVRRLGLRTNRTGGSRC